MSATGAAPGDAGLRPFRAGLWFGFFNAVNWQVALGTPMVLLAEALGASTFQAGLAYAFTLLMTPVQVLATALLPKLGYKRLMLAGWGARAFFLVPPIVLSLLAAHRGPEAWMIHVLTASVFLFTLLRSLASCAWVPWLYDILPVAIRGRYFATDQVVSGLSSVGVLVACSMLFAALPAFQAFAAQYGIALFGAVVSWFALRAMPDGRRPVTLGLAEAVRRAPRITVEPGRFRAYLWLSCWAAVATAAIAPFCAYYLSAELRLEPSDILIFTTLQYAGVVAGSFVARDDIDRSGPRPYFHVALALFGMIAVFWIVFLATGLGRGLLPLVYLLLGMANAVWTSANLSYLPAVTPERDQALHLAVHGALTSFLGGLAPVVWGVLLRGEDGATAMNVPVFLAFFGALLASVLGLVAWLRRLDISATPGLPRLELGSLLLRPHRAAVYLVHLVDASVARDRDDPPR